MGDRLPLKGVDNIMPSSTTSELTPEHREKYNDLVKQGTELFNKSLWEAAIVKYKAAEAMCRSQNLDNDKVEKLRKRIAKLEGLVLENAAQSNTAAVVKKEEKSSRNTLVDKPHEVEEKLSTNLIASRREQQYLQDEKPCSSKSAGLAAEKLKDLHVEEKPKHKLLSNPPTARKIDSDNEDQDVEMCVIGDGFSIHVDLYKRLYSYQREGILWMWKLHRMNKGGILADDMGLGKTVQVIAFFSGLMDAGHMKSALVIAPVSLFDNWQREFEQWAPGIEVGLFHGQQKARLSSLSRVQRHGGVLLTSYQTIVNSVDDLSKYKNRDFTWDYIVLDEGHKIKNPSAKCSKGVYSLEAHHRLVLTGTPVQNNLKEMWVLFDWAHQGTLLGTAKTFELQYDKPITRSLQKDATMAQKRLGAEMSESLARIVAPFQLRRTKAQVRLMVAASDPNGPQFPSLTRKNDLVCWVYISELQQRIYQDYLQSDEIKLLLNTSRSPLVGLVVLKKICDHPRLLTTRQCIELDLDYMPTDAEENTLDQCAIDSIAQVPVDQLMKESGKLAFLMLLVDELKAEGHRTLIFSQSVRMLNIIDRVVRDKGHRTIRLDGSVKPEERASVIDRFTNNKNINLFLLTTQVGGVGLTITAADRVVIFDPFWNPAVDSQAVDRAFRIGQTRNVVVYRLISCGTVEEKIYRRQVFKDTINKKTTGDTKNPCRHFSKQQLAEMFVLDDPHMSLTQMQIAEMHEGRRKTDADLDKHIRFLTSLNNNMFGLSDHDLMFEEHDEDIDVDDISRSSISSQVMQAQNLLQLEGEEARKQTAVTGKYLAPEVFASVRPKGSRIPSAASTTMVLPPPRTTYNSDFDEDAVRQIRELSLGIKVPPSSLSLDDSVFAKGLTPHPAVPASLFKKPEIPSPKKPEVTMFEVASLRQLEFAGMKSEMSSPLNTSVNSPIQGPKSNKARILSDDDDDDDIRPPTPPAVIKESPASRAHGDVSILDDSRSNTPVKSSHTSFEVKNIDIAKQSPSLSVPSTETSGSVHAAASPYQKAALTASPLSSVKGQRDSIVTGGNRIDKSVWLEDTVLVGHDDENMSTSGKKHDSHLLHTSGDSFYSVGKLTPLKTADKQPTVDSDVWQARTVPRELITAKSSPVDTHKTTADCEEETSPGGRLATSKKRDIESTFSPAMHKSTVATLFQLDSSDVPAVSPIYKKRRQSTARPSTTGIVLDSDDDSSSSVSVSDEGSPHTLSVVRDSMEKSASVNVTDPSITEQAGMSPMQTSHSAPTPEQSAPSAGRKVLFVDKSAEVIPESNIADNVFNSPVNGNDVFSTPTRTPQSATSKRRLAAAGHTPRMGINSTPRGDQLDVENASARRGSQHLSNSLSGSKRDNSTLYDTDMETGEDTDMTESNDTSNASVVNESVDEGNINSDHLNDEENNAGDTASASVQLDNPRKTSVPGACDESDGGDSDEDDVTEEEQQQYVALIQQSRSLKREGNLVEAFKAACAALKIYGGDERLHEYASNLLSVIQSSKKPAV